MRNAPAGALPCPYSAENPITSLNSIVATTDFSDITHQAVRRAALIAARHNARMTLLHVVNPSLLTRSRAWFSFQSGIDHKVAVAQTALGRLAAAIEGQHDLRVTLAVQVGHPFEEICRMTEEADLLVLGSTRVNPLQSLIFGTPTEQLLRLVRRPVLVAKQAAEEQYRRILVAVDLDRSAESILRSASSLAPAASLHVFHALSTRRMDKMRASGVPEAVIREVRDGEQQQTVVQLRSLLASIGLAGALASVDYGDPPWLTLQRQQEIGADLIVLGKDKPLALCQFLLGSVPQRVLSSGTCDVLVMPRVARLPASPREWTPCRT